MSLGSLHCPFGGIHETRFCISALLLVHSGYRAGMFQAKQMSASFLAPAESADFCTIKQVSLIQMHNMCKVQVGTVRFYWFRIEWLSWLSVSRSINIGNVVKVRAFFFSWYNLIDYGCYTPLKPLFSLQWQCKSLQVLPGLNWPHLVWRR